MKEAKRKIYLVLLLIAAALSVSCTNAAEMSMPGEKITPQDTPEVSETDEGDFAFVGIVDTVGTAEDFN